jgi:hypothetical protein
MTSDGRWVNNEHIAFKNVIKPCKFCGFCPYGTLVEDFPLPSIPRSEAIAHNNYMASALAKGTFDKPDPKKPFLMTRDEAIAEIENFNPEDYPDTPAIVDKMACKVFGHHCPVYYHVELFAEEDKLTQEEIDAFETEMLEYLEKVEEYNKEGDEK